MEKLRKMRFFQKGMVAVVRILPLVDDTHLTPNLVDGTFSYVPLCFSRIAAFVIDAPHPPLPVDPCQ